MFDSSIGAAGGANGELQLVTLADQARPPADLALSFVEMRQRVEQLDEFYRGVMQRGTDYDLIPGTPEANAAPAGRAAPRRDLRVSSHLRGAAGLD
jgi:hypothetical protein